MKTLTQHIAESKALHQNVNIQEKLVINKNYNKNYVTPNNRLYYLCFCIGRSSSNNLLDIFVYDIDKIQEMTDDRVTVNATKCTNDNSKDKEFFVFDYDKNTDVLYNKIKISGKQYLHSYKVELCFTDKNIEGFKAFKELCEFLLDNNYYVSSEQIFAKLSLNVQGKLRKIINFIRFKNGHNIQDGIQKYNICTTYSNTPLSWIVNELLK